MKAFIYIKGSEAIYEKLNTLPDKIHNKVLRKSVQAGADVAATLMRPKIPRKSGAMFRSISTKVVLYRGACWGGAGPESSYFEIVKGKKHQPSHIFHLIERGFTNKKNGMYFPGQNIIPKISGSPLIEGAVAEQMDTELQKVWAKE